MVLKISTFDWHWVLEMLLTITMLVWTDVSSKYEWISGKLNQYVLKRQSEVKYFRSDEGLTLETSAF